MDNEVSKKAIWTGRVLSGLAVLFLLFDGTIKFFMDKLPPEALEAGEALQWPIELAPGRTPASDICGKYDCSLSQRVELSFTLKDDPKALDKILQFKESPYDDH